MAASTPLGGANAELHKSLPRNSSAPYCVRRLDLTGVSLGSTGARLPITTRHRRNVKRVRGQILRSSVRRLNSYLYRRPYQANLDGANRSSLASRLPAAGEEATWHQPAILRLDIKSGTCRKSNRSLSSTNDSPVIDRPEATLRGRIAYQREEQPSLVGFFTEFNG